MNNYDAVWQEDYCSLLKWVVANHRCPTRNEYASCFEKANYDWLVENLGKYLLGKLSENKKLAMEALPFWNKSNLTIEGCYAWEMRVSLAKKALSIRAHNASNAGHGRTPIPTSIASTVEDIIYLHEAGFSYVEQLLDLTEDKINNLPEFCGRSAKDFIVEKFRLALRTVGVSIRSDTLALLSTVYGDGVYKLLTSLDSTEVLDKSLWAIVEKLQKDNFATSTQRKAFSSYFRGNLTVEEVLKRLRINVTEFYTLRDSFIDALRDSDKIDALLMMKGVMPKKEIDLEESQ